ncbi:MAG: hypothetical protein IJS87_07860, partial [Rhodocyclaceae bacterium]|nr:hypothetical protein [Rhodocyclaceae bacterium]
MHIHTPRLSILARTLLTLGCTATGLVSVAHAEVQGLDLSVPVAQEPIGRGTGMAPNVLFVLDDSSSMTKAFMPDDLNDKIDRYNLPPSISTTQSEQVESVRPLRTYWSLLYYPGGHAYGGRMWYDSSRPLPLNTMRFEPNRTYLRWASGEQRPSPDADLPRVKDSNSYAV